MNRMIWIAMATCVLVFGCGGDGKNACQKADQIRKAGLDEGCRDRSDECWYCRCYNQGQTVDVELQGTEVVYGCKDPEPCQDNPDTPEDECNPACEEAVLASAEQCLDDKESCKQDFIDMQNSGCANTPKP